MPTFHGGAVAAAPLAAWVIAVCLGATPALAKPASQPSALPDICHSRYLIACVETPTPGPGSPGSHWRHKQDRDGPYAGTPGQPRYQPRWPMGRGPLQGPFYSGVPN